MADATSPTRDESGSQGPPHELDGGRTRLGSFRGVARLEAGGSVVSEVSAGFADPYSQLPCASTVRFQLASVSKQFTAAAILRLVDLGRLSLQDPVAQWLPGCPPSWQQIKVRHLLTHTSGIPHWSEMAEIDLRSPIDPAVALAVFQRAPLLSPPGSAWSYSSPGYVVLAHIVQRVADTPYAEFVSEQVFRPNGMTATFAGNAGSRDLVAVGHRGGVPVRPFELDTVGMGAGDIWSTTGDMMAWDSALENAGFLSGSSVSQMFTPQVRVSEPNETGSIATDAYALAWFVGRGLGKQVMFHPGDNPGFVAMNLVQRDERLRLVVLSNEEQTDVEKVAVELLRPGLS